MKNLLIWNCHFLVNLSVYIVLKVAWRNKRKEIRTFRQIMWTFKIKFYSSFLYPKGTARPTVWGEHWRIYNGRAAGEAKSDI